MSGDTGAGDAFGDFFRQATGSLNPYPYQRRLADSELLPQILDVPTGLGKTAAVVLAWLWRRRFAYKETRAATPRRLVYCLPMRVLVEQTFNSARQWLTNLGLLAEAPGDARPTNTTGWHQWSAPGDTDGTRIAVSLLMGGEDQTDWALWPEHDAFLVGTQDMALSRALNRGYAARRARWPIEFGLLHNDCLWVFDEVQLMGSGLATTAQLDAFARKLWKPSKPTRFLWMSATMGDSFLQTRDRRDWELQVTAPHKLSIKDLDKPAVTMRVHASKTLHIVKDRPKAAKILETHPRGRISLVMLNTVPVAKSIYADIGVELMKSAGKKKERSPRPEICLLHGRFRAMDRKRQMERLLEFLERMDTTGTVPDSEGFIVVSTQVVEAGFDLSSARLWSEIAPWPSIIQRLGRLNREGLQPEASASFWMPKADDGNKGDDRPNAKRVGPYRTPEENDRRNSSHEWFAAPLKHQREGRRCTVSL